jgi:hypothetical protein
LFGVAPGPAGGLHQAALNSRSGARKSLLKKALSALTAATSVTLPEIVSLGEHLRADQHVHLAGMHLRELLLQAAGGARAGRCGDAYRARGFSGVTPRAAHVGSSAASCSWSFSVPRPTGAMSRLPHSGQARGTRSL